MVAAIFKVSRTIAGVNNDRNEVRAVVINADDALTDAQLIAAAEDACNRLSPVSSPTLPAFGPGYFDTVEPIGDTLAFDGDIITIGGEPEEEVFVPPTDDDFAFVVALLHFDGLGGSTTFTDESNSAHVFVQSGGTDAITVTPAAEVNFGTGSLDNDDGIEAPTSADWDFGTGDFTIECFVRPTTINNFQYICATATGAGNPGLLVEFGNTNTYRIFLDGSSLMSGGLSLPTLNEFSHFALNRKDGVLKVFLNGVEQLSDGGANGATAIDSSGNPFHIGGTIDDQFGIIGQIDEFRITKGLARYENAFTPPTESFPDQ